MDEVLEVEARDWATDKSIGEAILTRASEMPGWDEEAGCDVTILSDGASPNRT